MMKKNINIAIDGYSSSGKSSLAKEIAKEFNLKYIDSGAMYRAITLILIQNSFKNIESLDNAKQDFTKIFKKNKIDYRYDSVTGVAKTMINNVDFEKEIRDKKVSDLVSIVSKSAKIRDFLIDIQKGLVRKKNVVMDGRDIGTAVMPDAELKFFIEADIYVRAKRRFKQLCSNDITLEDVSNNLKFRDDADTNRKNSPLKKAKGCIVINNTNIKFEILKQKVFKIIREKLF